MPKTLAAKVITLIFITGSFVSDAWALVPTTQGYLKGCKDPKYHEYIDTQFALFEKTNRRFYNESLRDYQRSIEEKANPYQIISDLSRHLKFSAQFDNVELISAKIDRIFEHANSLSMEAQIAGDAVDNFSTETHSVGIARAWIAYKEGREKEAFDELLKSIDRDDSQVLRSFGPDFDFVRHIYADGHVDPVVAYINKTKSFWTGRRPNGLRFVWLEMINAGCKVQFSSDDTRKALELGIKNIDDKRN
jgi:hypothetical protein